MNFGGPNYKISIEGKVYTFEDHPWIGPAMLKKNGDPAIYQPGWFLEAVTWWYQSGKKVGEDGLCVWEYPAEPITKTLCKGHAEVVGWTKPRKGE
jgi:hypothetical protein